MLTCTIEYIVKGKAWSRTSANLNHVLIVLHAAFLFRAQQGPDADRHLDARVAGVVAIHCSSVVSRSSMVS